MSAVTYTTSIALAASPPRLNEVCAWMRQLGLDDKDVCLDNRIVVDGDNVSVDVFTAPRRVVDGNVEKRRVTVRLVAPVPDALRNASM